VSVINFSEKEYFSEERLLNGISMYEGQTDYRFKHIVYIVDGKVFYYKK